MIYDLRSWEKIEKTQSRIFANGKRVMSQKTGFATSEEFFVMSMIIGIISAIVFLVPLIPFFTGQAPLRWEIHDPITLFVILGCIWMGIQSKEGIKLRNEQGGIHPKDTLLVLDGEKQILSKQQGTNEEVLIPLSQVAFHIRIHRGKNKTFYKIEAHYPQGKQVIASCARQDLAEAALVEIKSRLGI